MIGTARRSLAGTTEDPESSNADRSPEEDLEPDAERRLMCIYTDPIFRIITLRTDRARRFIADPDPWSILALIGTASGNQAPVLRDALYRHVAFQTFMGVTFAVCMSSLLKNHPTFDCWTLTTSPCSRKGCPCFTLHSTCPTTYGGLCRSHCQTTAEIEMESPRDTLKTSRSSHRVPTRPLGSSTKRKSLVPSLGQMTGGGLRIASSRPTSI